MFDPNEQTVEEFAIGLVTRIISDDQMAVDQARKDFARFDRSFEVVIFLTGMITGFFPDACANGHPLDLQELWQQYLLDWQQKPDDGR